MVPPDGRVTWRGTKHSLVHSPAMKFPPEGKCRWSESGLSYCTASKNNGSIGFPPVFKLSFLQKHFLGMSDLCP